MNMTGAFVVTGATGGLGSALAEKAYKNGFPLALIARSRTELNQLKIRLERSAKIGKTISVHCVDLRDEAKVAKELKAIFKEHGKVRALVNNAGTWMGTTNIENLNSKDMKTSFDLNFYSAFNITTALLQSANLKSSADLSIVNIGATASMDAWVEVLPFSLAKGALRDFSRALARDLGPKGVHVSHCIIDGMLDNERTRKLNPKTPANRFINLEALAEDILRIALQDKSCWTAEWDVRPYNESW